MKTKFSLFIFGLVFIPAVFLSLASSASAATLTSMTVVPATNNVDNLVGQASATWRFTTNNETVISTSTEAWGAVEITFPQITNGNWNFQGVTASSTALGGDLLDFATTTIYIDGGARKIILAATSTQTSADNNFIIDIKGVTNPVGDYASIAGSKSWSVRTCVLTEAGNPNSGCASDLDSAVSASATIARRGGFIDDWSFTASNYSASGAGEFTITFTASTTLNIGEKIHVNFPVGFILTNATTSDQIIVTGGTAQVASTTIATSTAYGTNRVILTTSNGAVDPAATSTVTFKVGNIINPVIGAYQGFRVFTTSANGGLVDGTMFGGMEQNGYRPPPVDSIQIGGANTIKGQAKVRQANGTLRNLTAEEIAEVSVNMGCPDKMFFVGTKRLDSTGSFVYSHLLDATYMMGMMPDNTSDPTFFASYLQPNMLMMNVSGGETASTSPIFETPDGVIQGSITGGPANGQNIFVRAYTPASQSFSPVFTTNSYATQGLNSSGAGYFELPIKSGQTWNLSIMTDATLTSGGTQYWTPDVSPVFIDPGKTTTSLSAFSFVAASKTLNVTLKDASGATINESGGGPHPCINIRRAGSEIMGPGGQGICTTTGGVYQMKVPAGAFVIQIMMPDAGFKEYPVNVASTDTIVNQTIIIARPTTYITGTVTDPDGFPMQGVSVMAQGSNGSFSQGLTASTSVYTLYVSPGIYRVEAFAPGYGPLGAVNVTLSGASATHNFTITSGNFKKITGRIYTDADSSGTYTAGDTAYEGVGINAYGPSGSNFAMSRNDGTYTLMVPAGTGYTVEAWSKDFGRIGSISNVDASDNIPNKNFTLSAQGYLQIKVTNASSYGLTSLFAHAYSTTTPAGNGSDRWTATSTDLVTKFSLPAGFYKVEVGTPGFGNLMSVPSNASASTTSITANQTTSLTITLPAMATLSGTATANATVWASRTNGPGKYNTTADSDGAYSMKMPTGYSYMVGASLPGYVNMPTATSTFGGGVINLTLTASAYNISGTVSSSAGGNASEGFVWATKAGNAGWVGSEINADGTYSLAVDSGSWMVYADAPCHNSSSGTTQTGSGTVNITLTSISNCSVNVPQIGSIVPSSGGTIATSTISVNIPPNALGTGSSNVSFSIAKPDTIPPSTLNAAPIANTIQRISASDSNGTAITTLSNSIEIKMTYEDADILAAGTSESNLQLAYWNTTTNTWDPVSATIDTDLNTITANIDHLTDFAPIYPTAEGAPTTPADLVAVRNGDTGMSLSWATVSGATGYLLYRDTSASGSFPYLTTKISISHSDSGLTGNTTYYYKVTSSNANGESAASSAESAATCASVSNGVVSGASCALACNSGYHESSGSCVLTGGGGIIGEGGGGSSVPTPVMTTIPGTATTSVASTPTAPSVATPSPVAQIVSPVFNATLKYGITSDEVKQLQELLAKDSEIYPEGIVSGWFGQLTRKAVQKFQAKYGIVSSGDENTTGYGLVGPKTQAKLQEVFSSQYISSQTPVAQPSAVAVGISPVFSSGLGRGMSNGDVKRLQQLFNSDPDTKIAESGVGSSGSETEYFGSLTEKAVQKFQVKYNLAQPGDAGYGYVGPKTRAKLGEVFGK